MNKRKFYCLEKNMKESQSNDIIKQKKLLYETYIIKGHIIYYLNG